MAIHIGDLITAVIGVVVGLALLPVVNGSIEQARGWNGTNYISNMSGGLVALLNIVPMLYIVIIVVGMITFVVVKSKSD